mmetsp:Transcript_23688/g.51156  ORF Transcript_23688/g.51156 Transcript_23688/m.51156 type:complete len:1032 (+) Transcript_23688:95-3190(+)
MDAELTWEILSRLSSPSVNASNDELVAAKIGLPFFAQREEEKEEEEKKTIPADDLTQSVPTTTATTPSADIGTPAKMTTPGRTDDDLSLSFLPACPLRILQQVNNNNNDDDDDDAGVRYRSNINNDGVLPALYSREAIANEFLHVLRMHCHHYHRRNGSERVSSSEMCMWLGMEEEDVSLVGDWLCVGDRQIVQPNGSQGQGDRGTNALVVDRQRVCKVYNPTKQRHEYSLVENLRAHLRERIRCHNRFPGSASTTAIPSEERGEYVPSLETIANQSIMSSSNKNIEWTPTVVSETGMIKQLAREMEMTCEDVAWLIEGIDSAEGVLPCKIETSMELVHENQEVATDSRIQYLEKQVLSCLYGVTVPTSLERLFAQDISHHHSPEQSTVATTTIISMVQSLCQKGMLHGVISTPSSVTDTTAASTRTAATSRTMQNTIYIPHIHSRTQRKIADSFFESNGYLTGEKCAALGVSRNRMETFVKESFPTAVLLTNSIIDPNKVCRPLEHIVQDAIVNQTLADLRSHLPDDIASSEEDVKDIINDHLVVLLQEQPHVHDAFVDGLTIINRDMVFFFCKEMNITCKQLLMPLVEEWCKQRAREIDTNEEQLDKIADAEIVPLLYVAAGVGEKYPDLLELQRRHDREHNSTHERNIKLSWNVDERNDATIHDDGPLVEFCRRALFSTELQRTCARSLRAEVDRLDSTRRGGLSVSARSESAAEMQHAGDSFESSFRTLCHLLQVFSKSLDALGARSRQSSNKDAGTDDLVVAEMKRELLLGCGSCLARLITEYCLFQHAGEIEGDGDSVLFSENQTPNDEMHGVVIPSFYQAVNMSTLNFPFFVMQCRPDQNGKPQNPLNYLRSEFPGSAGLGLSQMWSLCSENGESMDDSSDDEPGKHRLDLFLHHLSETCLTLVGIPFSVLDKKTERKVLAARREGILNRLEKSQDKEEILMCAIILIMHQVKNMPIAGTDTANLVMNRLFEHDKKIPYGATEALRSLKSTDFDESSSLHLIARVKKFGAAKNSKALAAVVDEK